MDYRHLVRAVPRTTVFIGVHNQVKTVVWNTVKISMETVDDPLAHLLMFTYNDVIDQRRSKK